MTFETREAANLSAKAPRLVLRFAIYTALALALAATAVVWFTRQQVIDAAEHEAILQDEAILKEAIAEKSLEPSDFVQVSPARRAALDVIMERELLGLDVVKVNLLARTGHVTYSRSDGNFHGEHDESEEAEEALNEGPVYGITVLDDANGEGQKALEAYLPVRFDQNAEPAGVLELYRDYAPVERAASAIVKPVAIATVAALIVLYALLFPLLRRATAALELRNRKLSEQARELEEQNERLLELDSLKDEFIALISHELRTPLTSIHGYVELLRQGEVGELTDEQSNFLDIISRSTVRLQLLSDDLLFIARAEAGKLQVELGDVELRSLLDESIKAAQPAAARQQIELVLVSEDAPTVSGDRARLGQLFDNLISNALKFTPAGGLVEVKSFASNDHAVVEVRDTGMGISPAEQERLFERFFRTSSATEQAIQGTGLGLAISKAIADGHGGGISVESEKGVGTTFRVELNLALRAPQGTPAREESTAP